MNLPVNQIICGDNMDTLRTLPNACIDSCVTDPPYGLAFMGKRWDYDVPGVELWQEVLRVLKPGGHLLAFAGTRTQHRMAVRIEDAGFEIRDMIAWVYGSGFSKGFNLKREPLCDCQECGKPIPYDHDNATPKHKMRSMRGADIPAAEHPETEQGEVLFPLMQEQDTQENGATRAESETVSGEKSCMEGWELHRAEEGVQDDPNARPSTSEEKRVRARTPVDCGTDAWPSADGVGGSSPQGQKQAEQPSEQSADLRDAFGALDDGALRGRGQCSRCGKLKKEYEGWSSNLKPALEPITVARKPLIGTVAANVLEHGTGALNVDGCRVPGVLEGDPNRFKKTDGGEFVAKFDNAPVVRTEGRYPANLIHDGSDEVVGLFPETSSGSGVKGKRTQVSCYGTPTQDLETEWEGDTGSAARFFYCAKADAAERRNSKHPTVKPVALMRYLVRLVTPPGGLVLDPFGGSGTTAEAARLEMCKFLLLELSPEYCKDAAERLRQGVLF